MDHDSRSLLRAAILIQEKLAVRQRSDNVVYLPDSTWRQMQRSIGQIEQARQLGWNRAAHRLQADLLRAVDRCGNQLRHVAEVLEQQFQAPSTAKEREIYRDILALREEFEEVRWDLKKSQLAVVTEPIVLRGIDLGRFEICLEWDGPAPGDLYRLVALDPNPASANSEVTHPHVQDEHLCEGEGHAAIRSALAQGRLFDFFVIVGRILGTYAEGSAYVELNHWNGIPCDECGSTVDEYERTYCRGCNCTLCDGCQGCCTKCDTSHCSQCLGQCDLCGDSCCRSCVESCSKCLADVCSSCQSTGLCASCLDEKQQAGAKTDGTTHAPPEPPGTGPEDAEATVSFESPSVAV